MASSPDTPDLSRLRISRSEIPGDSRPKWPYVVLLAAVLVIVSVVIFRRGALQFSATEPAAQAPRPEAPELRAAGENQAGELAATGYVVAQRKAAVSSKATGRLKALHVVEGDTVKAGQEIGDLENDDIAALVDEQQAELSAAEAKLRFSQAELDDAAIQKRRNEKLSAEKVVSSVQLDASLSRYKKALADFESNKANITVIQARLQKAKVDLEYTFIRAPFNGTVLTKDADIGEVVAPFGNSANARAAVVTIADMSSLEVEADVSESHISQVFLAQQCSITLDSYPNKKYQGVVKRIVPTVDRAKATVQVKIGFIKLDDTVLPEMSAKVIFKLKGNP